MEVHAHSHSARKKWYHYFWEFLMLFLAVFCGFLAEIQLEHKIERDRAKILAKNLYNEINGDSISVTKSIANRVLKETECNYFIDYVKDSNLVTLSPRFFTAFTSSLLNTSATLFEPNDGVLNQLRNSGELRYFKNKDLQVAIGNLSVKIIHLRTRNDREYSYVEMFNRPLLLKHFDFRWYEEFTQNGKLTLSEALKQNPHVTNPAKLANLGTFNRLEAENVASYYRLMLRASRQLQYKEYKEANQKVLELLRKEFKLK